MMVFITLIGLVLNLIALLPAYRAGTLLTANDVKAVALQHKERSLYLDVKSQKTLLALLNQGEVFDKINHSQIVSYDLHKLDKVVIHRFNNPKIDLIPLGIIDNKIVFHVIGLSDVSFLVKDCPQELQQIFITTHDS